MSAPTVVPKPTSPEKLERTLLARLGLDASASPEDVGMAHEAVSAYLAAAPRGLRSWARAQAAAADEAFALLTDPAALARAVALVGAGARPAVAPGGPATPPAHRDTPAPAAAAAVPAAAARPAGGRPAPRVDENGRRIVSDDEIDALLAEVDPTVHREVVGTAEERARSMRPSVAAPRPGLLAGLAESSAARYLALMAATAAAVVILVVVFDVGGRGAGGIGAGITPAPSAAPSAPVLDQAKVAELMAKIQANPKDADALMALGDEFYAVRDFATAASWYTKVTETEPAKARGYLALGATAFNEGDMVAAETSWKKAVDIDEKSAEGHYYLGYLYFYRQPPDMAAVQLHWNRVVELDPQGSLAKTVKAHLAAFASAAPGSPAPSGSPATSPTPGATPSAAPASPAPSASPQP